MQDTSETLEAVLIVLTPPWTCYPAEAPLIAFSCGRLLPKTCLEVTSLPDYPRLGLRRTPLLNAIGRAVGLLSLRQTSA